VSDHRVRDERRQAEEALASLRRQYELILNSADEGIYGVDLDGNINFINPKAAELLKWTVAELLGKPAHATIHHTKSDGSRYPVEACPVQASLRTGATQRVTNDVFWRKDGRSFRVDYVSAPTKDKGGQTTGAIVTFRDITERKRAMKRLIGLLSIGISRDDRPK
jgi:PAS domain S-box-containing protein